MLIKENTILSDVVVILVLQQFSFWYAVDCWLLTMFLFYPY